MNSQLKVTTDPISKPRLGDTASGTVPDADTQAVADIGQLAFLAATYESLVSKYGANSDLAQQALKEFQTIYSYYHINGDTITFDYNEGSQPGVSITDPNTIELLKHLPVLSNPPSAADVGNYLNKFWNSTDTIHWADGTDQTFLQRAMEFFIDTKFTMANNIANTITNTSILLFYCALANNPGAQLAGTLDKFILSIGYKDGAMIDLGNIFAITEALCAHLHYDSFLNPDVIAAGLSIKTDDPLYQVLGQFFSSVYKTTIADYTLPEEIAWGWESRFFPYYDVKDPNQTVNAPLVSEESALEKRLEIEKHLQNELDQMGKPSKRKMETQ